MRIAAIIMFGVAAISAVGIVRPPSSIDLYLGDTYFAIIHLRPFFVLLSAITAVAGLVMLRYRHRIIPRH
jgi:hypothetical protein